MDPAHSSHPSPPPAAPPLQPLPPLPTVAALAERVAAFAAARGVSVVAASLIGTRAWGLPDPEPTPANRPPDDPDTLALAVLYRSSDQALLGLVEPVDVIEEPARGDLPPLIAWEARRACRLLLRSNARVWEWLASPHPIGVPGPGVGALAAYVEGALAMGPLLDHALASAKAAMNAFFAGDPLVAARTKYLHVSRGLMAADWILERETAPPPDWPRLRAGVSLPSEVAHALDTVAAGGLVQRRDPVLDAWIDDVFRSAREKGASLPLDHPPLAPMDALYRALGPADLSWPPGDLP